MTNNISKLGGTTIWGRAPYPRISSASPHLTQPGKRHSKLAMTKMAITDLGIVARRDEFRDQIELGGSTLPASYKGCVSDRAITWIRNKVDQNNPFDPGTEHVHDAIKALAEEHRFNPVVQWLESQCWDGVGRLDDWLVRITGTEDNELHRAVGVQLMLAMVARALYPGTKFDICVILEGPQLCGKSSFAKILAGDDFFADAPSLLAMNPKDRGELLSGRWVAELAELSGMSRADAEVIKAIITQTHDHFRGAYERVATKRPRTCIFIGTTNNKVFLVDTTGNRRFIPIHCCDRIDLNALVVERDQLFAEAYVRLAAMVKLCPGVVRGQPLPSGISLDIPAHLRAQAAAAAEDRRIVEHAEDVLQLIVDELVSRPNCARMTDLSYFLSSIDIQNAFQHRVQHPPNNRILVQWMDKLGWDKVKLSVGKNQIRGYAKAL